MVRFSLRQVLIFTTQVAIGLAALANASPLVSQLATIFLLAAIASNGLFAIRKAGRAKRIGFCICTTGAYLALLGWSVPSLMWLCAPQLGWYQFYDVDGLWNIFSCFVSLFVGQLGGRTAHLLAQLSEGQVEAAFHRAVQLKICLPATLGISLLGGYLVSFDSPFIASILNYAVIAGFYLAVVGCIYGTRESRIFAFVFGTSLLAYLTMAEKVWWPISYYLGPAPLLYHFDLSNEPSWVTGHLLFGLVLGFYCGLAAQYFIGSVRRPYRAKT